jgi:hypothetical protein
VNAWGRVSFTDFLRNEAWFFQQLYALASRMPHAGAHVLVVS